MSNRQIYGAFVVEYSLATNEAFVTTQVSESKMSKIDNKKDSAEPSQLLWNLPDNIDEHIKSHDIAFTGIQGMTPRMWDIVSMLFTRMKAEDWFLDDSVRTPCQPTYNFDAAEVGEFLGLAPRYIASTLKAPLKNLASIVLSKEHENGDFRYVPVFSELSYKDGVFRIVPNNRLRNEFIAKANTKGYSRINNKQYLALKDSNSKKTLDLLSRYKSTKGLYPISISVLKFIYGMADHNGKLQKRTYESNGRFIREVLASSLKRIAESDESKGRIELLRSDSGTIGYELIDAKSSDPKVRFLYNWLTTFSDEDIDIAHKRVQELLVLNEQGKQEGFDFGLTANLIEELISNIEIAITDTRINNAMINGYNRLKEKAEKALVESQKENDSIDTEKAAEQQAAFLKFVDNF